MADDALTIINQQHSMEVLLIHPGNRWFNWEYIFLLQTSHCTGRLQNSTWKTPSRQHVHYSIFCIIEISYTFVHLALGFFGFFGLKHCRSLHFLVEQTNKMDCYLCTSATQNFRRAWVFHSAWHFDHLKVFLGLFCSGRANTATKIKCFRKYRHRRAFLWHFFNAVCELTHVNLTVQIFYKISLSYQHTVHYHEILPLFTARLFL